MIKKAFVKEIIGGKAVLLIKRECMCAGQDNCGKVCFALQSDVLEVEIDNEAGAKAGDLVEIEGNTPAILTYCAVAFILPVFLGLVLYFTTENYVVSGLGFILSVGLLYYFLNKKIKIRNDFKITKIWR
jgi:hypothetical protein